MIPKSQINIEKKKKAMKEFKGLTFWTQVPNSSNPTWDTEPLEVQRSHTSYSNIETKITKAFRERKPWTQTPKYITLNLKDKHGESSEILHTKWRNWNISDPKQQKVLDLTPRTWTSKHLRLNTWDTDPQSSETSHPEQQQQQKPKHPTSQLWVTDP